LANGLFTGPGNDDWYVTRKEITIGSEAGVADSCVVENVRGGPEDGTIRCYNLSLPHARGFGGIQGVVECYSCHFTDASNVMSMNIEWSGGSVYDCTFDSGTGCQLAGGVQAYRCVFTNCVTPVTAACELHFCRLEGNLTREYDDELTATIDHTIIAFAPQGTALICDGDIDPTLSCCDLFDNAGGDWTGCIADQGAMANNFSADPVFCGQQDLDQYTVSLDGPCAVGPCGLIGARPAMCSGGSSVPAAAAGPFETRVTMIPNPVRGAATIRVRLASGGRGQRAVGSFVVLR
jgi:hypothetical protein